MTGSLQQKSGYYYMVLNFKDKYGRRKPKWISTGLKIKGNRRKAEAMLRETLSDYADIEYIEPTRMLFSQYIAEFLELHKSEVQISTYDGYMHMFNKHIKPYFDEKKITLSNIKPIDIQRYYTYCQYEKGLSPNTVVKHHQLIHKCLETAVKNCFIRENVSNYVDKPKKIYTERAFLEVEDIKKVIKAFKGDRMETVVFLAAYYGLRRSEILGLKWDDIDFDNGYIKIRHKCIRTKDADGKMTTQVTDDLKTEASYREFPMCEDIVNHLNELKERIADNRNFFGSEYCTDYTDFVCVDEQGQLINPDYVTDKFSRVMAKMGFKDVSFHCLRHSCGSMLLYLGFDIKQIQKWLGHSSYQTTANIYSHVYHDSKENIIEKLSMTLWDNQERV